MDYSSAKSGPGALLPGNASAVQWSRVEPLVTPLQLVSRHLFGVDLVSKVRDPVTGKFQIMTPDILKDFIDRAVSDTELEVGIDIFPNVIEEKQAFDQNLYLQYGYFRTERRPVAKIHCLSVSPSTNVDVFVVPPEWIETGRLHQGQINILPMTAALGQGAFIQATSAGGAAFVQILGNK